MKILFQFIRYNREEEKYDIEEKVFTFSKDVMSHIRKKANLYLEENPMGTVLATGYFYPTIVTYKFFYDPFTCHLLSRKLCCDYLN